MAKKPPTIMPAQPSVKGAGFKGFSAPVKSFKSKPVPITTTKNGGKGVETY